MAPLGQPGPGSVPQGPISSNSSTVCMKPLATGTGDLVVKPFFHKSVSIYIISANFAGLGVVAAKVLKLVASEVAGTESLKFMASSEAVEISFNGEEEMVAALAKGLIVKDFRVTMMRCLK